MSNIDNLSVQIISRFLKLRDDKEALHLSRFFKTKEGEYGYGDKFLGIKVPVTRSLIKEYKDAVDIKVCLNLIQSEWHEIRLAGFLLLIQLYHNCNKHNLKKEAEEIVRLYIRNICFGNNWDLVDLVSPHILGHWLLYNPDERNILDRLAEMNDSLWHQRVAIVSTLALIKAGIYEDTLRISQYYLTHKHDLIHKATGWMLREMGKRGGYDHLIEFLDRFAPEMPRTALRYSIERLQEPLRQHYLNSASKHKNKIQN